jgi:hypothetical protein
VQESAPSSASDELAKQTEGGEILTVPLSFYWRLSIVPEMFVNSHTGAIEDPAKEILGLDDAVAEAVSKEIHAAAERCATIQKRRARVTSAGTGTWIIEIDPAANVEKVASLEMMKAYLRPTVPESVDYLSAMAASALGLAADEGGWKIEVIDAGETMDMSSNSSSRPFSLSINREYLQSDVSLSWIGELVGKSGGK